MQEEPRNTMEAVQDHVSQGQDPSGNRRPIRVDADGYLLPPPTPPVIAGAITALDAAVTVPVDWNHPTLTVAVSGTWVATLQFEGSINGATWQSVEGLPIGSSGASGAGVASTTGNDEWAFQLGGYSLFRIRASAFTSGLAVIAMQRGSPYYDSVDTELPAARAASDALTNPTAPDVLAWAIGWDGAEGGRLKTNTSGHLVIIGAANATKVSVAELAQTAAADNAASVSAFLGAKGDGGSGHRSTAPMLTNDAGVTFGFLRSAVGTTGVTAVNTEGTKATYSASVTALAPAATATDIFTIIGSGTKTIRVTRIQISGVATAAGAYDVQLVKRSTADTLGTSTAPTLIPHDSNDAAATSVVAAYTANPTLGTAVGVLQVKKITVSTVAGAIPIVPTEFRPAPNERAIAVLRGAAQQLCVNLNGVTMTGGSLSLDVSFTEE